MDDLVLIKKSVSIPLFAQVPQEFKNEHARLCYHAAKWLVSVRKCSVALTEVGSGLISEMPDAIGWEPYGACVVIECKSSRSDFLADKKKPHRTNGMGDYRFFMVPDKLVNPDEVPDGWGLLYLNGSGSRITMVKDATKRDSNLYSERAMLLSCVKFPEKLRTKARYHTPEINEYYNGKEAPCPPLQTTNEKCE